MGLAAVIFGVGEPPDAVSPAAYRKLFHQDCASAGKVRSSFTAHSKRVQAELPCRPPAGPSGVSIEINRTLVTNCFRLVAAVEIWQAYDRCRRYQLLTCYLPDVPCASQTGNWLDRSAPDNLNGSFRKLRTGAADPMQSYDDRRAMTAIQPLGSPMR